MNGEDDDNDRGERKGDPGFLVGVIFSASVDLDEFSASVDLDEFPLVLDDVKTSVSVRMDFFLPFGAPFLRDVPCFCPADLGSSLEINIDKLSPTAVVFLRNTRYSLKIPYHLQLLMNADRLLEC